MNKPKDTLFTKWVPRIASLGDLGPGYPVPHFAGEPTKLTNFLVGLGIPKIKIIDFDRGLTRVRGKISKKLLHVAAIFRSR